MKKNITIGMDLRDQTNVVVAMDEKGKEIEIKTICNTELSIRKFFSRYCDATVAIEPGTHSPWISRLLIGPSNLYHSFSFNYIVILIFISKANEYLIILSW